MATTTSPPWKIVDHSTKHDGGYIEIRGPNDEAIATIFPGAGKGGVGNDVARLNATLIVTRVNALS